MHYLESENFTKFLKWTFDNENYQPFVVDEDGREVYAYKAKINDQVDYVIYHEECGKINRVLVNHDNEYYYDEDFFSSKDFRRILKLKFQNMMKSESWQKLFDEESRNFTEEELLHVKINAYNAYLDRLDDVKYHLSNLWFKKRTDSIPFMDCIKVTENLDKGVTDIVISEIENDKKRRDFVHDNALIKCTNDILKAIKDGKYDTDQYFEIHKSVIDYAIRKENEGEDIKTVDVKFLVNGKKFTGKMNVPMFNTIRTLDFGEISVNYMNNLTVDKICAKLNIQKSGNQKIMAENVFEIKGGKKDVIYSNPAAVSAQW